MILSGVGKEPFPKGVLAPNTGMPRRDGEEGSPESPDIPSGGHRMLSNTSEIMNQIRVIACLGLNYSLSSKSIVVSLPFWGFTDDPFHLFKEPEVKDLEAFPSWVFSFLPQCLNIQVKEFI